MYEALGHDGPPTQFWRKNVITDAPLERCPRRVELDAVGTRQAAEIDEARTLYWPHYRRGFLPVAGGVRDQPALTMDLIEQLQHFDAVTTARFTALRTDGETPEEGYPAWPR